MTRIQGYAIKHWFNIIMQLARDDLISVIGPLRYQLTSMGEQIATECYKKQREGIS